MIQRAILGIRTNYSNVKYITVDGKLQVTIITNPIINNQVTLNIYSPVNVKLRFMMSNTLGETIFLQAFNSAKGNSIRTFNVSNLTSGIYLVEVTDGIVTRTLRVVK